MTRYQEKLQGVLDAKLAKKKREEFERQAEEDRQAEAARLEDAARKREKTKIWMAREKSKQNIDELKRAAEEKEAAQIESFQKFVDMECRKRLDQIQNTGEVEICPNRECGKFTLKYNNYEESEKAWKVSHCGGEEFPENLSEILKCARAWESPNISERLHIENDPRVDYVIAIVHSGPTYHHLSIQIWHGDPEEWTSNIPRALEGAHNGGYRSASENADIEYHKGSADFEHHKGYAVPILGWWEGINESVSNFFLDLGFFGGRK